MLRGVHGVRTMGEVVISAGVSWADQDGGRCQMTPKANRKAVRSPRMRERGGGFAEDVAGGMQCLHFDSNGVYVLCADAARTVTSGLWFLHAEERGV